MTASPPDEPGLTVAELAAAWAASASRTTYLPMSGDELEQLLTRLINRLVAAVSAAAMDEQVAIEVGAELVAHDLTGSSSISRSIEVLGDGLPRLAELHSVPGYGVDGRDAAVSHVLRTLAGGYAEALRQRTLDEQHQVTQALLQAKLDTERELWISEARFRQVFSESAVGIAISDLDGTIVTVNRAFARIVGRSRDDLVGAALANLLYSPQRIQGETDQAGEAGWVHQTAGVQKTAGAEGATLGDAYRKLATGELTHFRRRGQLTAANGEVAWIFLAGFLLRDPEGVPTHHVVTTEDITELHLLQQELSRQGLYDRLTGLPNEHYFMGRLEDVLEAADPSTMITVCRVNLDNFSVINDGIGLGAGDFVLCSVATQLQELVAGERALVARMATDDFAILIEESTERDLRLFAATMNTQLCEPVYYGNQGIAVSVCIGMVRRRAGGISAAELVREANITLHRAKSVGCGQWDLYDMDYDIRQRHRCQLAAEIPGAWENGEIDVQYQPLCRLDDGGIVAQAAVLRWDRADGSVVGHSDCLELAEQTGLVTSLGRWIVEKTCGAHPAVSHHGPAANHGPDRPPLLRVDLTAQLSQDPDLVEVVRGALAATGLHPGQLWLGVPLTALARGHGDVVDNVGTLAELGVQIVLIGAPADLGYLTYLEDLRVSAVEIAPDIVARIAARPGHDSLVARAAREIISLVHSADVTVIVPGVDTAEQAQWWHSAGADTGWGAHFGPPVPNPSSHRASTHRTSID
ncbi:MAG: EAL domain-containing protein [Pseudonocardiaceae bacterium]